MNKAELLKTAKPILFNTEMVRAILDGRKAETRRPIKPQNIVTEKGGLNLDNCTKHMVSKANKLLPEVLGLNFYAPYQPGDVLYVRETWCEYWDLDTDEIPIDGTGKYYYRAGDHPPFERYLRDDGSYSDSPIWRPSIHIPKAAARIFLRVTDVRVERLQDITEEGARSEGISEKELQYIAYSEKPEFNEPMDKPIEIEQFKVLWDSVYKARGYGWDKSPWVWVIKFERLEVQP